MEHDRIRAEDHRFRREVVDLLLGPDYDNFDEKASLQDFLEDAETSPHPKRLAYRLFCSALLYISKNKDLTSNQEDVLYGLVQEVSREWFGEEPLQAQSSPSPTLGPDNGGRYEPMGNYAEPSVHLGSNGASFPQNAESDGLGEVREALERTHIGRSPTPEGFIREKSPYVPESAVFHNTWGPRALDRLYRKYPKGVELMCKQGWDGTSGLGPRGEGIKVTVDDSRIDQHVGGPHIPYGLGYAGNKKKKRRGKWNKNRRRPAARNDYDDQRHAPSGPTRNEEVGWREASWYSDEDNLPRYTGRSAPGIDDDYGSTYGGLDEYDYDTSSWNEGYDAAAYDDSPVENGVGALE
ncbi:hypothetical protein GGS20DRAFT_592853 [Poronia punctata]|nr:hypothetical protein GGS20DRAFT_592853 [Poronia punctata]